MLNCSSTTLDRLHERIAAVLCDTTSILEAVREALAQHNGHLDIGYQYALARDLLTDLLADVAILRHLIDAAGGTWESDTWEKG